EMVQRALGKLADGTAAAADTLLAVAKEGKKEGDRVRAAVALLDRAFRGLTEADALQSSHEADDASAMGTADVLKLLAGRLRQVDQAELPTGEKGRLTAALADVLLRAIGVEVLDKRLEALQAVLIGRKDKGQR